ncbi:MAG: DegT/DnrJ/EryC1/StrS family aminotransferase [Chitinophagales bacterium]|nr:DegT/DnrJ/EryC1/StrS family aminotransferase [Chitinophagales bacterium]MDW8427428.1 DegT/DnrJ/EryC1/StrS family aminotransferase [Chitinophagales bacterium]
MRKIEMVDLRSQYQRLKPQIDASIQQVLESAAFINGPPVHEFARKLAEYLQAGYVIPCANGTDALQIALMALELKPGDEVICPSFTYFATVEVIALLGLTPVFVDVNPRTFNIEPDEVKKAISPRTKAIIPVHLYGQSCDMEPLLDIARHHGLPIIEDNAQAIGAEYVFRDGTRKKTGTIALIGCTSFFPSKNLGCYGDGGALITNDAALAERLRMIANHGQSRRYYHDLIGVNSRLDSLQAAVLMAKLPHLDDFIRRRRAAADFYDAAFAGHPDITIPYRAPYSFHVFHQYTLIVHRERDALVQYLHQRNIPAMIYYPVLCHQQKAFVGKGRLCGTLHHSYWLSQRVVSLPMHTELDSDQLQYIANSVKEFFVT